MVYRGIKTAKEIGKGGGSGYGKYIWVACMDCGKERWVELRQGKPRNPLCHSCANKVTQTGQFGENAHAWKGGTTFGNGYAYIYKPSHPHSDAKGYVKRAILVLEQKLGRPLLVGMISHHKDEIKDDDRPENLEEKLVSEHHQEHALKQWEKFRKARREDENYSLQKSGRETTLGAC